MTPIIPPLSPSPAASPSSTSMSFFIPTTGTNRPHWAHDGLGPTPTPTAVNLEGVPSQQGAAATHTVTVGKTPFKFDPEVVQADIGDVVYFEFFPTNYSIVRSSWDYPCIPYEDTIPQDKGGEIWSGWKPVSSVLPDAQMPSYQVSIKDADPRLIYSGSLTACNQQAMVMIINPNSTTTIDAYRNRSLAAPFVVLPGQSHPSHGDHGGDDDGPPPWPPHGHGGHWGGGWGSQPTTTTTTKTETPTALPAGASRSSATSHSALTAGAIAGIAIGGVAILAIIILLAYLVFLYHRKEKRRQQLAVDGPSFQQYLTASGAQIALNRNFSANALGHTDQDRVMELPRNTIIIPVTEAEKERYVQSIMNRHSGGLPGVVANHNRAVPSDSIDRRMSERDEFGTPGSPAEI